MNRLTSDRTEAFLDAKAVLASLATKRPVFHSEADFKFSFAWEVKVLRPELDVRLETHPKPNVRLDLQLTDPTSGRGVAVELKYMTRLWAGSDGREQYALKNHGASDLRSYDVVKDIERVERFVDAHPARTGFVIALSNDPAYWRQPTHGRVTNAASFRLYEGVLLTGERRWGPNTGGTAKGREAPLKLYGSYSLRWSDYSRLDSSGAGTFRTLVVPIGGSDDLGS